MSSGWARAALFSYRWLGAVLFPLLWPYLAVRTARGKEEGGRRRERYGRTAVARPEGPLIWFHAASVGETSAVVPLIKEVQRRGIQVVLTTGTVTSAAIARERLDETIIHQYVPIDIKTPVSRFLDHWRPDMAIIAESEIWPMTILELGARHTPQILVNGRLSDRSYQRWLRSPHLADALFENLSLVVAQSEVDAKRFADLGAQQVAVSGNLKVDTQAPPCNIEDRDRYRRQIGRRPVWAAISTFEGEDEIAVDVHAALEPHHGQLTIIVPRHPERGDAIAAMLAARGLTVARRSHDDDITPETDVFLGDTIGEMGLYLSLASIAFIGKSLTGEGGQNPLEPAMMGCAIVSGPNVQNFRDIYARLIENGGGRFVADTTELIEEVHFLLSDPAAHPRMAAGGEKTIRQLRGGLKSTIRALEPYLNPLTVKARLQTRGPHDRAHRGRSQW
ncbi:lipid IV(A) 3-deoxy-D-manno-octulosonic acid transferase [Pseudohoeflea coraliihabitans]|uniref:3-deoxy-D-manno-octulosonic acid transferase n=1 Tax=Pseudohoeflea coraliihabitans TaxID=2860393 RepID=A0ABS6WMB2_9HYPH|nr:lipid IV(A) 3-deoxy-D-manno-octulosonic acid transferase [Pseudohoeflea sp. DP4N28-3]MBW3097089.1 lipid IV(A) 3-deoxy-D-manno-octulosonic acid transferase [Pseudohoeflea sp. DP4N28-3]